MLLRGLAFLIIWSETSHNAEPSESSQEASPEVSKGGRLLCSTEYMGIDQKPKWN